MDENKSDMGWLKGNLPAWLIAALLMFSVWSAQRWFDHFEADRQEFRREIHRHAVSIQLLEGKMSVMERGQDMVLIELKEIRKAISASR